MSLTDPPALGVVAKAREHAIRVHANQVRRHTGEPYWLHLAQVAGILQSFTDNPNALAAAWLHDTIEDCGETHESLSRLFGADVADYVLALSDLEEGTRAARKAAARDRLSKSPPVVQTIKVCDLISNLPSIRQFEPKFYAQCFHPEAVAMVNALADADERAKALLRGLLDSLPPHPAFAPRR